MQKIPILHLVRDTNPWHLELISRELSKPAPICIEFPLSPVIAFLAPVGNPGSPYLHEDTSEFGVFFGSPQSSSVTLFPQYSLQYFLLRYSYSEHTSLEELHTSGPHEENHGMKSDIFSTLLSLERNSPIKIEYCLLLKKFDEKVLG